MTIKTLLVLTLLLAAAPAQNHAAENGTAAGAFSYDGTPVTLTHAVSAKVEGLFDSTRQDLLIVITDKPLGPTAAADDVGLSLRARTGEIAALMLRIDGDKLVNVSVFHKGLAGKVVLPGAWFAYKPATQASGTLLLNPREFDGHKYAVRTEFSAAPAAR
jgi:hypothetical protein